MDGSAWKTPSAPGWAGAQRIDIAGDMSNGTIGVDLIPTGFGDFPQPGYPAFIRDRGSQTDQWDARLSWQPSRRWGTTFLYSYGRSSFHSATDPLAGFEPGRFDPIPGFVTPGTRILGAQSDVHSYTLLVAVRPAVRGSVRVQGTLQDQQTRSAVDVPETLPTWAGRIYRVEVESRWQWNARTELDARYQWAMSDFHREIPETAFPAGLFWREHLVTLGVHRRCSRALTLRLRYGLWRHEEPTAAGYNDVLAHLGGEPDLALAVTSGRRIRSGRSPFGRVDQHPVVPGQHGQLETVSPGCNQRPVVTGRPVGGIGTVEPVGDPAAVSTRTVPPTSTAVRATITTRGRAMSACTRREAIPASVGRAGSPIKVAGPIKPNATGWPLVGINVPEPSHSSAWTNTVSLPVHENGTP